MFGRLDGNDLLVTCGPDAAVHRIGMGGFGFISAMRWCPHRDRLVVTASAADTRSPDVLSNQRGDLRLWWCDPRHGTWRKVFNRYTHDPVCLPDGGYVVHRGAGLTFLDSDGKLVREVKVGRFNWGPPMLSANRSGNLITWVRWQGDNRKLQLEHVQPPASKPLRTSVYSYGWLDDHTIIYLLGDRPRRLDVASGATTRFGRALAEHIRQGAAGDNSRWNTLAALPSAQVWHIYGHLQVTDDHVWYSAALAHTRRRERVEGLFRANPTGTHLQLMATVEADEQIEHFRALPDGSATMTVARYQDTTIVARRHLALGPLAEFLNAGWRPFATSDQPEPGFHCLPEPPHPTDTG